MRLDEIAKPARSRKFGSWELQTREEIAQWLKDVCRLDERDALLDRDLRVHTTKTVEIPAFLMRHDAAVVKRITKNGRLPVEFMTAPDGFTVIGTKLRDCSGFPALIGRKFELKECDMASFAGLRCYASGEVRIDLKLSKPLPSLAGLEGLTIANDLRAMTIGADVDKANSHIESIAGLPSNLRFLTIYGFSDISAISHEAPELESIYIGMNPDRMLPSGLMSLFDISNFREIEFNEKFVSQEQRIAFSTINKHIKDKNPLACRKELMKAGIRLR